MADNTATDDTTNALAKLGFNIQLDKLGIDPSEVVVLDPQLQLPDALETCISDQLSVPADLAEANCTGITPIMILSKKRYTKSDKFEKQGYTGFWTLEVLEQGKDSPVLRTHSDHDDSPMADFLRGAARGTVFRLGQFKTASGYEIMRPIPLLPEIVVK